MRKCKNPEESYIFDETVLSIICDKCGSNAKKIKIKIKTESIVILEIISLINNILHNKWMYN